MKRILFAVLLVAILAFEPCFATEYDLSNMTTEQLDDLVETIAAQMEEDHELSSNQKASVETAVKTFVEDSYGTDNVSWAWFDYTYTREWDFFTMSTHADIKKSDGGKAEYDVYGEVVSNGETFEVVFVQVGTEAVFDQRNELIKDERVREMLGLDVATAATESTQSSDTAEEPQETLEPQTENIVAKRGDKSETVKALQEMLIRLGYLSGSADGSYGQKTESALFAFQSDNGFEESSDVTQIVYTAIEEACAALPEPVEYSSYTAKELYSLYEKNEISADNEVKGEIIEVTGVIDSIDKGWLSLHVYLRADSYGFQLISCSFSKDDADKLAALEQGEKVTIRGECTGISLTIIGLDDCELAG